MEKLGRKSGLRLSRPRSLIQTTCLYVAEKTIKVVEAVDS